MNRLASLEDLQTALDAPPFHGLLNMRALSADWQAGAVIFSLPYDESFRRSSDSPQIHGGVIAAFIDIAGDYALAVKLGYLVPTINLSIDYLRPASSALTAEAAIVKAGRTIGVVDVKVTDDDGKLVAVGRGTYGTKAG